MTRFALLALVACSSGKPKQIEDARRPQDAPPTNDAAVSMAAPSRTDAAVTPTPTMGNVQVRVEWPTMPLAARVSPGTSPCNTPLAAQVSPTTTWGIPEVVVFVENAPPIVGDVRVSIDRCGVSPRIAVGARISIASASDQPLKASLSKRFASLDPKRAIKAPATSLALPIAGHEVTTELETDAIYRIAPEGTDIGDGWIIASTASLTDATGTALIKDVPPGKHAVRVWLPPRGGQSARMAKGEVAVAVGDLAEVTLTLE